ncbi:class Ib ribonucleoside-diphosphate reductase assembly flavoprotein NrdI [Enterococcus raffinosus]|uniref:class Ib ribonucleoside-diphosphate reductase assembly flavoprotein NrdI n=1 Tax=Enterococcus raffinosus TaxID=71452 RepID=UPI001C47195E|nr:class Ib ribonucleoside-diphosphate reductase assembly flavoprotein NrdI [Enterococcus raffinosus]MDT2573013.1 class Ib ribonucleoside-diphosphate reductase assembly flavoprotein NrdI [Enterococcus raffinosus]QXJ60215.1 class Ib ribonucleoside-diphosphate reductase assembly flavoprotein NrdI [Enterococcus raffinosus]
MNILYISISGNTKAFIKRLEEYGKEQHELDSANPLISAKEISENSIFEVEESPFFTFVPTYLEGGNGVDSGDTEILTEVMREYLEYEDNYKKCLGVVGSGNKNFNYQYCLTAKQYSEAFGFPFLADYELRGTSADCEHVYQILKEKAAN